MSHDFESKIKITAKTEWLLCVDNLGGLNVKNVT